MARRSKTDEITDQVVEIVGKVVDDALGGNSQAMLQGFGERLARVLDDIAEAQEEKKIILAEAKLEGFTPALLARVVAEKRRSAKKHAAQLTFELEQQTYRRALGVETDLAKAQEAARREAEMAGDR